MMMQEQAPWPSLVTQQSRITEHTRFRRLPTLVTPAAIEQLDYRRERQVYLLTNGTRTIGQIARLLGMTPVEVAGMMKRLFEQGYVDYAPFDESEGSRTV
jgi:hypothetical protein